MAVPKGPMPMTRLATKHPMPHSARALVLTCMDFRLTGAVSDYLAQRGLAGSYDHIVIAGAALGVMNDPGSAWATTFWDHVRLARELHGIERVIVIDHRDCGACKAFMGADCADDPTREATIHEQALGHLACQIEAREPGLGVELLLMALDGSVSPVPRDRVPCKAGSATV